MLLHGWTATSDLNWFKAFESLGQHFNVVSFDSRGHGRGLRVRRPFRLVDCADDVVAVADALGLASFIPVGYSMGGAVASLVWRRHRARVDGIVLSATASTFHGSAIERFKMGLLQPISLATRMLPPRPAQALYEKVVWSQTKNRSYPQWMVDEIRSCHPRLVIEAGAELGRFDSSSWITQVDVPAAVIVMTRDTLVPTPRQEQLVSAIPSARRFAVDGDHIACVTDAGSFVPALIGACLDVAARTQAVAS